MRFDWNRLLTSWISIQIHRLWEETFAFGQVTSPPSPPQRGGEGGVLNCFLN
jgi:hypothetical protein